MKTIAFAAAGLLAFAATSTTEAVAADPTRMNVEKTIALPAPPAQVWAALQNFSDMSWVPPVKGTTATQGNEPGSVRTIDLGGPKLVEKLDTYNAADMSYSYEIVDSADNKKTLPVSNYKSTIRVAASPSGGSVVTWDGWFSRADTSDSPADGMDDKTASKAVRGVYDAGLGGLKQRFGG